MNGLGCPRAHRTDERGASWVAGGMLAPHSEGWPARSVCCSWVWRRWRYGTTVFLDGLPADVVTAHVLGGRGRRADAADLTTVGEWLAAKANPSR